jgi:hypothetical protein
MSFLVATSFSGNWRLRVSGLVHHLFVQFGLTRLPSVMQVIEVRVPLCCESCARRVRKRLEKMKGEHTDLLL